MNRTNMGPKPKIYSSLSKNTGGPLVRNRRDREEFSDNEIISDDDQDYPDDQDQEEELPGFARNVNHQTNIRSSKIHGTGHYAELAKRREILIFPGTAGNTGNSREILVFPGKYCFRLFLLVLVIGIPIYYYYAAYNTETESLCQAKDEKRFREEEHVSLDENKIKEPAHDSIVLSSKSDIIDQYEGTYERIQASKTGPLNSEISSLNCESTDLTHEGVLADLQLLKEQFKDILEKQTKHEMNTTYKLEVEKNMERLKIELYNNMNFTMIWADKIKYITETKFSDFAKTLSDLENDNKVGFKELQKSLSILTIETQGNVSELRNSVKKLYAEVEDDFKAVLEDVKEQLGALQNDRQKADQRINYLQELIDNRIFPNTFNKDVALFVFLAVVAVVLFLTFCVYTLRSTLEDLRSDIDILKTKKVQTDGTRSDEMPGRKP